MNNLLNVVEALLFASPEPLPPERLSEIVRFSGTEEILQAVNELNRKYADNQHSFRIREIAGGFQFYTLPEYAGWIEALYAKVRKQRLSKAALETLSIVAYKQPVTRTEIDLIRGVQSDAALKTLLERELVNITGRAQTVGRPLLYGTTEQFLVQFGLNDLSDLPKLQELESVVGPAPDSVTNGDHRIAVSLPIAPLNSEPACVPVVNSSVAN
jgi:segregation and condensation protein B